MKSNKAWIVFLTGLAGLSVLAQFGCSSFGSHGSAFSVLNRKSDSSPARLGQVQSDQIGRPLPGSKVPAPPSISEASPQISDETRSHVALAMGEVLESVGNFREAQLQYEQ